MEFLKDFGFNPVLLIAQIINFLIVLVVLKKFMYKPVMDMLNKRKTEIESGLKNAEEADKKLKEADEKESEILQKAHNQAEKIISDAKAEALLLKEESDSKTKIEAEKILENARATITQETKDAEEALTQKVGHIAIVLLEKSLKGVFGEKEQEVIIKKATEQINKNL